MRWPLGIDSLCVERYERAGADAGHDATVHP
jgi:hypothetical protein